MRKALVGTVPIDDAEMDVEPRGPTEVCPNGACPNAGPNGGCPYGACPKAGAPNVVGPNSNPGCSTWKALGFAPKKAPHTPSLRRTPPQETAKLSC